MQPEFNPPVAFEQVTQRLDGLQASQNEMKQVLIRTVDIQTSILGTQQQMQHTQTQVLAPQNRMLHTQNQLLDDIRQLQGSQLALLQTQNQLLDYMKFTFNQQAKWNERQDQFNIIIRELKGDVREIKKQVFGEIEARLVKSEDFMNDQLRKAS